MENSSISWCQVASRPVTVTSFREGVKAKPDLRQRHKGDRARGCRLLCSIIMSSVVRTRLLGLLFTLAKWWSSYFSCGHREFKKQKHSKGWLDASSLLPVEQSLALVTEHLAYC